MVINTHLGIVAGASVGLTAATTYTLMCLSEITDETGRIPLNAVASLAAAFCGQVYAFLSVIGPVAVHALSGRWSWSVRALTLVSAYGFLNMAFFTAHSYDEAHRHSGYLKTTAEVIEGAVVLGAAGLFYLLLLGLTLVWIGTRGRRFRWGR